uniref:Uncharacterized protein n=1 Tax=Romanomermis culicivorax TaxID=13658 RepID=A0A915HG42_ROMCU
MQYINVRTIEAKGVNFLRKPDANAAIDFAAGPTTGIKNGHANVKNFSNKQTFLPKSMCSDVRATALILDVFSIYPYPHF